MWGKGLIFFSVLARESILFMFLSRLIRKSISRDQSYFGEMRWKERFERKDSFHISRVTRCLMASECPNTFHMQWSTSPRLFKVHRLLGLNSLFQALTKPRRMITPLCQEFKKVTLQWLAVLMFYFLTSAPRVNRFLESQNIETGPSAQLLHAMYMDRGAKFKGD